MVDVLAVFIIIACGVVASIMAKLRDEASANQYRVLIGVICTLGGGLIVLLALQPDVPLTTTVLIAATWMACAIAGLNMSVNPGMSLLFALMFSVMVVLGHIEGRGALNALVAASLAIAWLIVGWLVRYNRVNPGAIPLLVITTPLLFIEPAY